MCELHVLFFIIIGVTPDIVYDRFIALPSSLRYLYRPYTIKREKIKKAKAKMLQLRLFVTYRVGPPVVILPLRIQ
jgi:hypothetical protein